MAVWLTLASTWCIITLSFLCSTSTAQNSLDVRLRTGTFRGFATPNATEAWLGVPFAYPPVGALRFKAPRLLTTPSVALKNATTFGNACPQQSGRLGAPISEDCLNLNIFRPQGTARNAKLPVLVWIYGGGFMTGAASSSSFNPTRILQHSVAIGKPIIFVSVNYRLNTFGFLASSSMDPRDLNAGLQDQRVALEFLQDNIAAFGGDPTKVTIWGQSAGAGGAESQLLFPPARPLFQAVISDSSTGPFKNDPGPSTYDLPGMPFSRLLTATGCSAGRGAIACLQGIPFQTLMSISNSLADTTLNGQFWEPTFHPRNFLSERPSQRVLSGKFLHVPYLAGTNVNEGVGFSTSVRNLRLSGDAETSRFNDFILDLLIDNSTITSDVLNRFNALYAANDPTLGAPFNTGDSLFDRAEAWYTEQMYLGPRRLFFEKTASLQPMYAYFFKEFIPGNDPAFGVPHGSELALLFGPVPTPVETDFANQMLTFYINFVNDLNPGPTWPRYTTRGRQVLQLMRDNITVIPDDWDKDKTDFINSARVLAQFQK